MIGAEGGQSVVQPTHGHFLPVDVCSRNIQHLCFLQAPATTDDLPLLKRAHPLQFQQKLGHQSVIAIA